jgi:hypothetical protein
MFLQPWVVLIDAPVFGTVGIALVPVRRRESS